MSGLQGVRHSEKILLLFLLLTGSDRAERSKFVLSKSVLFHNVDPNAGPFTSAETEGHKWNILVNVCQLLPFLFLDQRKQMVGQLAMHHALNGWFCWLLFVASEN